MNRLMLKNKEIVTPGELLAKGNFNNRDGTYRVGDKIYSSIVGILDINENNIRVIKLGGVYIPKKNDYVIGIIEDMNFSNWFVNIRGPFEAGLPIREASKEYIDLDKYDMTDYYDYGDIIFAKILDITSNNKITLTMKEPELRKLEGGILTTINPSKVPRLIGKKGNMITMIKEKTKTQIIIGNNGYVWMKGDAEDIKRVKEVVKLIEAESHTRGLTDKIERLLSKGDKR